MPTKSRGVPHVYRTHFVLASGPGYWSPSITADRSDPFIEMDLAVSLKGEPQTRFWPYAIKVGGPVIAFDFKDYGVPIFCGPGEEIELTCTLFYGS